MVMDNAANMKKAPELLQIRHIPCFAHSLNLVIKNAVRCKSSLGDTFEAIDDEDDPAWIEVDIEHVKVDEVGFDDTIQKVIRKCKKAVTFFHKSTRANHALEVK